MESQKTHKQNKDMYVTQYQTTIYCINIKLPSSLNSLEKCGFLDLLKNWIAPLA